MKKANTELNMKGIEKLLDSIEGNVKELRSILSFGNDVEEEAPVAKKSGETKKPAAVKKEAVKVVEESTGEADVEINEEYLNGLSYNDLKKLSKSLGIPAVGSRAEITAKILSGAGEGEEEQEELKPVKKSGKPKVVTKRAKDLPEEEEEEEEEADSEEDVEEEDVEDDVEDDSEEEEEDVDGEEEDEGPSLADEVEEALADMSDEEIKDLLVENGIKAKGKRQALIDAVIKGVEDGVIEFGEDDEEDSDSDEDTDEEEEEDSSDEEEDISDSLVESMENFQSDLEAEIKAGKVSRKEMVETIHAYEGKKVGTKKCTDEELAKWYIEIKLKMVNDEGTISEFKEPYTRDGVPFCCGKPLSYVEGEHVFVCETCGNEYEDEDEE